MGFAISSVYHYVHEEGTRTHVSPSVSTNAKQEDLVYFTKAERELLDQRRAKAKEHKQFCC